ncbi:hypothetical protein J2T47_004964 [Pseudomonas nitroreducens]|nr:hypothetical protein [Pseudomonas nitroreducens]
MRVSAQGAVDTKEYIRAGLERGLFASKLAPTNSNMARACRSEGDAWRLLANQRRAQVEEAEHIKKGPQSGPILQNGEISSIAWLRWR